MNIIELAAKAAGFPTMTDYGYECLERLVANVRAEYEKPLKMSLEALDMARKGIPPGSGMYGEALAAIREALADQPNTKGESNVERTVVGLTEPVKQEPLCEDEGCPHRGMPHICFSDPSVLAEPVRQERHELTHDQYLALAKDADILTAHEHCHLDELEMKKAWVVEYGKLVYAKAWLDGLESAQPVKQEHSEQYWLHEINNAHATGYEKGRASCKHDERMLELGVPAQPVKQEPVASVVAMLDKCISIIGTEMVRCNQAGDKWFMCQRFIHAIQDMQYEFKRDYAAPVYEKRELVELTDYEIVRLYAESPMCDSEMIAFARAIIAAFKDKNK